MRIFHRDVAKLDLHPFGLRSIGSGVKGEAVLHLVLQIQKAVVVLYESNFLVQGIIPVKESPDRPCEGIRRLAHHGKRCEGKGRRFDGDSQQVVDLSELSIASSGEPTAMLTNDAS